MPRLALEISHVPEGLEVVTPLGRPLVRCEPGAAFDMGRARSAVVSLRGEPSVLDRCGWSEDRSLWFHVDRDGVWTIEQVGQGDLVRLSGAPGASNTLSVGERLEPALGLVLTLVDLDAVATPHGEPSALLDGIAEAPWDEARWHVLSDWLVEHDAPHAMLAAYELKLSQGTNDPELIGDYSATRRLRHQLDGELRVDQPLWKCGYVVACSVWLGPRDSRELERVRRAFEAPQFGALSRLTLQLSGSESRARLESVLEIVPKTVRTVGLQFSAPVTSITLGAVRARPERADTLRLHLAEPVGQLARIVAHVAAAGWSTLDFEGTRLTDRGDELAAVIAQFPRLRFVLGGTLLTGLEARSLVAKNVTWTTRLHEAVLVDLQSGAVMPLSHQRQGHAWGLPLAPFAQGWTAPDRDRLLASGDTITGSIGRRYLYLSGPNLDDAYRAWLSTWSPPPAGQGLS